jgi:hypothetical protein
MNEINLNCCGVYKITNIINGKYYIGSSYNIKNRIRKHFELLKRNSHHSIYFQHAYNKYGKESFNISILEVCKKEDILIIEQKYLDQITNWKICYNMSKVASGSSYDLSKHPNQIKIRKNISIGSKGKHTKPFYIDNIRYETLKDAADKFNVDIKTISYKIKNWIYKNYYYCNLPKFGEYDKSIHIQYWYKPKKENKKYYCNCGIEISEYAKYCKECRKTNQKPSYIDRPVIINNIKYESVKKAAKFIGVEYATLLWRIKSNTVTFKDYYYIDNPKDFTKLISIEEINEKISIKNKGNIGCNNKKPFKINEDHFKTLGEASKKLNLRKQLIWDRLNNKNFNEYKYD